MIERKWNDPYFRTDEKSIQIIDTIKEIFIESGFYGEYKCPLKDFEDNSLINGDKLIKCSAFVKSSKKTNYTIKDITLVDFYTPLIVYINLNSIMKIDKKNLTIKLRTNSAADSVLKCSQKLFETIEGRLNGN